MIQSYPVAIFVSDNEYKDVNTVSNWTLERTKGCWHYQVLQPVCKKYFNRVKDFWLIITRIHISNKNKRRNIHLAYEMKRSPIRVKTINVKLEILQNMYEMLFKK